METEGARLPRAPGNTHGARPAPCLPVRRSLGREGALPWQPLQILTCAKRANRGPSAGRGPPQGRTRSPGAPGPRRDLGSEIAKKDLLSVGGTLTGKLSARH